MARIAFINEDLFFRLGVALIIALLKKHNHVCEVFLERGERDLLKKVEEFSPDILAFSCTSGEHNWVIETAKKLKKRLKIPVLLGGPHPTFFPEIIKDPGIDMICIGEGEYATLDLLDRIDKKKDITKIKNLWIKKDKKIYKNEVRIVVEDLDSLPFVDRVCYSKYKAMGEDPVLHVYSTRGCPFKCSYCYNAKKREIYKGKGIYLRQRTPENVIEEIKVLTKKYPKANAVRFDDDLFIYNKSWLYKFLDLYKDEINIPFICSARANFLTEEMVRNLKEKGCDRVSIGVECGNEEMRISLLKKEITNKQLLDAARYCHKYNLRMTTYNMIGLPGETVENAIESINLNYEMNIELAWASIFQPYPGTKLADYSKEKKLIDEDYNVESMTSYYHLTSVLKQKNIKQLCNLHMFFWFAVKYPIFIPIIKHIIKLPPSRFHHFFFTIPTLQRRIKYGNLGFSTSVRLILRRIWQNLFLGQFVLEDK